MTTTPVLQSVRKLLPDALAGLSTFALIVGLAFGDTAASAAHRAASAGMDTQAGLLMVAAAASILVALNSAFVRHLLRAYARSTPSTEESPRSIAPDIS